MSRRRPPPRPLLPICLLLCLLISLAPTAAMLHTWTDRDGNSVQARIRAMDAFRLVLELEDQTAFMVLLEQLSAPDQEFARSWRRRNPDAPLADPAFPYPWPAEVGSPNTPVEAVTNLPSDGFHFRSPHYVVRSDIDLPLSVVREILTVFESTRQAVLASPLGLLDGSRTSPYPVMLFADPASYEQAGGIPGSGGTYLGYLGRMLVLLPNLGIDPQKPSIGFQYRERLYVLKHEAVHQLLPPWAWRMPIWMNEGLCEVFASMPYTHGRFRFRDFDHAFFRSLRKWDPKNVHGPIRIYHPSLIMRITTEEWRDRVTLLASFDLYNSAALLTHWFLHHDGHGAGESLIGFLAAIREGTPTADALETHLLRGRSHNDIQTAIETLARKNHVQIEWIGGWPGLNPSQ